jgi:glycosyltransferase involved in cell wall biosynthesis
MTATDARERRVVSVELSIVVCVLDEEMSIDALVAAVDGVLPSLGVDSHEYIFVDDGSIDGSWDRISSLGSSRPDVVGIRLLRNVGKENALVAGLAAARGDVHVPMDVDLQDPPEVLRALVREWRSGAQLVLARRQQRDDSWFRKTTASLTYRLLERGGGVPIPREIGDFRLMTKETTKRFLALPERSRYNKGLFALVSPEAVVVDYDRPASRGSDPHGSRQTLPKLVRLGINAIVSFSTWPLQALGVLGFLLLGLSIVAATLGVILRLTNVLEVPGQATLVVLFAFLLGFQALSTGILGLYVAQILTEVKRRPLFSVVETVGLPSDHLERVDLVGRG